MPFGLYPQSEYESAQNVRDKIKYRSAAATIGVGETNNQLTANTASGNYTLTLPNVAAAAGRIFTFQATIANAKVITLQDDNDSRDWTDKTLDTDEDGIALFSDGIKWWVLTNDIA